jgi:hypothetical protein
MFLADYAIPTGPQSPVKHSNSCKIFSFVDPVVFTPECQASRVTFMRSPDAEIKQYEAEPCIAGQHDPLLWWKVNTSRFLALAEMARVYLAIPGMSLVSYCAQLFTQTLGSSVAVERALSAGRDVISLRHGCLSAETISALMTAHAWIKLGLCIPV